MSVSELSDILPPAGTNDTEAWYRAYSVYQSLSKPSRNQWTKKRDHLISSIAYSVGLANGWRFAYVAYNSGRGAMFFPFLLLTFAIGIPMLVLECLLGQFTSGCPVSAFNFAVVSKGIGVSMVLLSWFMSLYSIMFIVYPIKYLFLALEKELPWAVCKKEWKVNNSTCVALNEYSKFNMKLCENISSSLPCPDIASNKFWQYTVVGTDISVHSITSLGGINWDKFIILGFTWGLIFLCTVSGLKGIARASWVAFVYPASLLVILFFLTVTQTGANLGLEYFFVPDFLTLSKPEVWTAAGNQVLMTFGLCTGGQILLSSYNKFDYPIHWHVAFIAFCSFFFEMIMAVTVFSAVGHVAHVMKTPVDEIFRDKGPGFMMQIFMEFLGQFPGPNAWSIFFLIMIMLLTISAQMSFLNVATNVTYEEIHHLKEHFPKLRAVICVVSFLIGICFVSEGGIYVVEFLHKFVPYISLSGIALAEVSFLTCCYGVSRFFMDIHFMLSFRIFAPLAVFWLLICPCILLLLFAASIYDLITMEAYPYPMRIFGRFISFLMLIPIPAGVIYYLIRSATKGKWTECFRPHIYWGPRDAVIKLLYTNWIKTRTRLETMESVEEHFAHVPSERKILDLRDAILAHMRKDILLNRLGNLFRSDQEPKSVKETTV